MTTPEDNNIDTSAKSAESTKNLINVKEIVRRSENPSPLVIVIIILVTMIVIYFIFINVIKKSITGIWIDDGDKSYDIIHDKWKDTIIVNGKFHGMIKGHLVIIYMGKKMDMGIWVNDKINWMDGSVWYCNYGY